MRKLTVLIAIVALLSATVYAAQVYGSLRENNQPVGANVRVEVNCNGNVHAANTDASGAYNIFAGETGKCTLKVSYKGHDVVTDVYSYANPVRYDFDLVFENGRYILRRR